MFARRKCRWSQSRCTCLYFLYIYKATVRKCVEKTEMGVLSEFVVRDNVTCTFWNFVQKCQEWNFLVSSVEVMEIICKCYTGVFVMPWRLEQLHSEELRHCEWRKTFLLSFCMAYDIKISILNVMYSSYVVPFFMSHT